MPAGLLLFFLKSWPCFFVILFSTAGSICASWFAVIIFRAADSVCASWFAVIIFRTAGSAYVSVVVFLTRDLIIIFITYNNKRFLYDSEYYVNLHLLLELSTFYVFMLPWL